MRAPVRFLLPVLLGSALALPAAAGPFDPVPVKVERVHPKVAKLPTMRFLRDNVGFIRSRYDLLHAQPDGHADGAVAIESRFLAYRDMLAAVEASRDSLTQAETARRGHELFASVTELGHVEEELDRMERSLADQRERLARLQADFAGRQRTALAVVVRGCPAAADAESLVLAFEDGTRRAVSLSEAQRQSLREGGALQCWLGLVEPREQVLGVALAGGSWNPGSAGWLTLDPTRDRLTFLQLDLSAAAPADPAAGLQATTWLHDDGPHAANGDGATP